MENKDQNIKDILNSINPNPNPEWVVNTRNNLIDKMNAESSVHFNFLTQLQMKAKLLSIIALAGIASFGGIGITLHAAQTSKPGDALFGLNKALENLQRNGITNPEDKLKFEQEILEKRKQALEEMKDGSDDFKISEAQKELAEQQVNFNRANSNRSERSPSSFPREENEFENEIERENENENENENEVENHNSQSENSNDDNSNSESENSGSNESENRQSGNQEKENESEDEHKEENKSGSSKQETEDKEDSEENDN